MIVVKSKCDNPVKEATFEAILSALFTSKGVHISQYREGWKWCVGLDKTPGADYYFNYEKYCEGEIGERIVIKEIAGLLFSEKTDPRPLTLKVKEILAEMVLLPLGRLAINSPEFDKSINNPKAKIVGNFGGKGDISCARTFHNK